MKTTEKPCLGDITSHQFIGVVPERPLNEAAEQQEANLSALFEILSDFLFVLDEKGGILHYNPAVEAHLGYGSDLVGQSLWRLRPPGVRPQAEETFWDTLSGGSSYRPLPLLKADGGRVLVEIRVTRTTWSGQPALLTVARDLTTEYAAQAALRESETRLRTLFETANDGLIILRRGLVVDCNAKALAIYGRKREELIGFSPDGLSPARQPDGQNSRDKTRGLVAAALAGQSLRFEWRHSRSDGSEFDAEVSLNAVQVGDETLLQAIVHDITEQKQQQARLEETLRLLDESQAIAKVGGWQANPRTGHLRWTREVYRLVEHPFDQPPADVEEGMRYYAPESQPEVLAALARSLESGEPFKLECRVLTRTGREFWAELRCNGRVDDPLAGPYLTGTLQDISERKQMEGLLQISEETLNRAQVVAHMGSWFLDCVSNKLTWSEETYRIFGQDQGCPLDLATFLEFVHADDRSRVAEAWRAALAGAPYDIVHRVAGFANRWVRERAEIRFRSDGQPLSAVGTVQDISERWEAEEALKQSHWLLQTIIETLPIRVFWKDRECRYLGCNTLFARDAGEASPEDLVGKDDFQLGWRDQADLYRAADMAVMASGTARPPYEEPQTTPEGRTIRLRTAKVPLRDWQGEIFGLLGIYEDVTREWHMREELRISQERLQLALQGANDGLWDLNLETGDAYYSPRWLGMLGYRPGEWPATWETNCRLLHPDDLPGTEAALAACREGRADRYEIELRMRHRDGHWVTILSRATLARDEQGQQLHPLRLVGTHVDISERKRAEEELEKARAAAVIANRAKSQFLANMSHEIRTPMNAILGLAQLLEQEPLPEASQAMVHRICSAGRSLMSILNDILDFSKIEAGQLELDAQDFDPAEVLEQLDHLLGDSAKKKGLTFQREAEALPGRLVGDPLRLEQILINLVGNAIKFTDEGEVVLRVYPLEVENREARLRFEVSDSGIGMAPEICARLFQPFTQADATITRQFGGTGLGLSISKRLVELMGGHIDVESQPGIGSTFWFDVPFGLGTEADPARVAASPAARGLGLAGLRILVVDDNQVNLFLAEHALEKVGATVTLVKDGRQALDRLRAAPSAFDLVLMDIQMPVMDGLTATRAIREQLQLAELPVIALTAGVLPEERQAALDAGINDFLPKPLELDRMTAMIRSYCPVRSR